MKYNIYLTLFFLLTVAMSCDTEDEDPTVTYSLSAAVSPVDGGRVILSPSSPHYNAGQSVTLTPEANANWVFQKWEGNADGNSVPLGLTMDSDKNVTAVFVKRDYPLNITIEGEGTVSEVVVTNPGGKEYPHGTTVELTPVPDEGWVFESWGGDLSGSGVPQRIVLDRERNVTAVFKRKNYPPMNLQYEPNPIEASFYSTGSSALPSVEWGGERGAFNLKVASQGFTIDSHTGEVSWSKGIPLGSHELVVEAKNSVGDVTKFLTIKHLFSGSFSGGYNRNPASTTLTDNDYHLTFDSDGTMIVRDKSATGTGTWEFTSDNRIKVDYKYTGSNAASLDAILDFSETDLPKLSGSWIIPGSIQTGYFQVSLVQ